MSTSAERMRRLRARRAAGLLPVEGGPLRDADELLLPAVEVTLGALKLGEDGQAVAQIARQLASAIDQAADEAYALRHLGPLLLRVLEALGATPAARVKPERPARPNRVAQLRAEHMTARLRRGQ